VWRVAEDRAVRPSCYSKRVRRRRTSGEPAPRVSTGSATKWPLCAWLHKYCAYLPGMPRGFFKPDARAFVTCLYEWKRFHLSPLPSHHGHFSPLLSLLGGREFPGPLRPLSVQRGLEEPGPARALTRRAPEPPPDFGRGDYFECAKRTSTREQGVPPPPLRGATRERGEGAERRTCRGEACLGRGLEDRRVRDARPEGRRRRRHRGIVAAAARRSWTRLYRVLERAQPGPARAGTRQTMQLQFRRSRSAVPSSTPPLTREN
jgi:hypothetical protein